MKKNKPLCATGLYAVCLAIFFMITLILTHTITAMFMAIILFVLWWGFNIYNKLSSKNVSPVTLTISILFTTGMFVWWIYASGHITILAGLIKWGFSIDYYSSIPKETLDYTLFTVPLIEQLLSYIGMFLFFSISFIAIFYMISKKGNRSSFTIAIAGVTPLMIGFFSLVIGYLATFASRWWYFAQILLAIPLATSFYLLCGIINNKYLKIFMLSGLTIFLTFTLIMSPAANVDNPIFSPNTGVRYALTGSEMQAIKTTSEIWDGTLGVDQHYTVIENMGYNTTVINKCLYSEDFEKCYGKLVLIREEIVNEPFKLFGSVYRLDYDPGEVLTNQGFSKIYNSGSVNGFLKLLYKTKEEKEEEKDATKNPP